MTALTALPNEIVGHIAGELLVDPRSFEAFSLSCKELYAKCSYTRKVHNEYRTAYRTWSNHGSRRDDMFYFLHEIAKDPLVAGYVESLTLSDRRHTREIDEARRMMGNTWDVWNKDGNLSAVKDLIRRKAGIFLLDSLLLKPDEWDEWCDEVEDETLSFDARDTEETFSIFSALTLLILLPNLRSLGLHVLWPGDNIARRGGPVSLYARSAADAKRRWDRVSELLRSLVYLARSPGKEVRELGPDEVFPEYRPFAKLDTLLPYLPEHPGDTPALCFLEPFVGLPLLCNIYSTYSNCLFTASGAHWPCKIPEIFANSSPTNLCAPTIFLRRLELVYSYCDPMGIESVLTHCCQLTVFKYVHEFDDSLQYYDDWNCNDFITAVGRSVGGTLKELAIRRVSYEIDQQHFGAVEDFHAFSSLERLEIDARLFVDTVRHKEPIASLTGMLPLSVRIVLLNVETKVVHLVPTLVSGLAETRAKRLVRLDVVVRAQIGGDEDQMYKARDAIGNEGAEWVDIMTSTSDDWHRLGWVGDFCERFEIDS